MNYTEHSLLIHGDLSLCSPSHSCVKPLECSVPCKVVLSQLEDLCRHENITCRDLGITKSTLRSYEVEYLCDYKRTSIPGRKKGNIGELKVRTHSD